MPILSLPGLANVEPEMFDNLPDNVKLDLSPSKNIIAKIRNGDIKVPKDLKGLSKQHTFISTLSLDMALALNFPIGTTDSKHSRKVHIQDFQKYVEIIEGSGKVRWGISVRWIVNYKTLDLQAKTTSIALIAASSQVGYVEAEALFQVIGIDSAKVTNAMPSKVDLNVDTYSDLNNAFNKIKGFIWDQDTIITPDIVSFDADIDEDSDAKFEESIGITWALTQINAGNSLHTALSESQINKTVFTDAVKAIYLEIVETNDVTVNPTPKHQRLASDYLAGFFLRR